MDKKDELLEKLRESGLSAEVLGALEIVPDDISIPSDLLSRFLDEGLIDDILLLMQAYQPEELDVRLHSGDIAEVSAVPYARALGSDFKPMADKETFSFFVALGWAIERLMPSNDFFGVDFWQGWWQRLQEGGQEAPVLA